MFRKAINWLSKRFPEQVVVTKQDYTELRQELASYNVLFQSMNELNNRLVALDAQVKRLNDMNGFVANTKGNLRLER